MDTNPNLLESLIERTENFAKSNIELAKLKAIDKIADVSSSLMVYIVLIIVVSLCFFTFNIGIALWLGDLTGKNYYGFFIVTGVYTLLAIIIYYLKNSLIKTPISDSIIEKSLK